MFLFLLLALVALAVYWIVHGANTGAGVMPARTQPNAGGTLTAASPQATTRPPAATGAASAQPAVTAAELINRQGTTIQSRFPPPQGFERMDVGHDSFAGYLRNYPLRPDGTKVKYFDGTEKPDSAYLAVADMDLYESRLQQCADTVLRLNAEYHYSRAEHGSIRYHFVSGFDFQWDKWRQGYRIKVNGNNVTWQRTGTVDGSESTFKAYLQQLFNYASTLSMEQYDLEGVKPAGLAIGDMFIKGGNPGHVVLVVDMAEHPQTGQKCFMLLQGFMPAQDAQILRNLGDPAISPWVMMPDAPSGTFQTPEYEFTWDQIMRFKDQPK